MHTHTHIHDALRPPKAAVAAVFALTLGLVFAVFFSQASPAQAHDQLIDVAIETTESGEASALRLTFSDNVLEVGTEIHVTAPDGGDATNGLPSFSGRDVTQPFQTPIADGNYTSAWRVVSSDGHPIEGGFTFDIANGEAGEVRPYTGEAETEQKQESEAGSAKDTQGSSLTLPLAIGAAAVVAVAVAIPMIVRMRRGASPAEGEDPRDSKE